MGKPEEKLPEEDMSPSDEGRTEEEIISDAIDAASELSARAELEAEIAKLKDQLLRTLAEMENLRRRAEKERNDAAKYGSANLARDILPVADSLSRALDAVTSQAAEQDPTLKALVDGLQMTEREMAAILERHGVKRLYPLHERFNHEQHQAMFEVETNEHPVGTVVQVMQAGYILNERLLRPALVGVAKNVAESSGSDRIDTTV